MEELKNDIAFTVCPKSLRVQTFPTEKRYSLKSSFSVLGINEESVYILRSCMSKLRLHSQGNQLKKRELLKQSKAY